MSNGEPLEIRIEKVGPALRLQVPEATARALGNPPAIRFYRDDQGRLRIGPTLPEIPGAIPIRVQKVQVARPNQPVTPPPLPPGRYILAPSADGSLVFQGMEGDADSGPRPRVDQPFPAPAERPDEEVEERGDDQDEEWGWGAPVRK